MDIIAVYGKVVHSFQDSAYPPPSAQELAPRCHEFGYLNSRGSNTVFPMGYGCISRSIPSFMHSGGLHFF